MSVLRARELQEIARLLAPRWSRTLAVIDVRVVPDAHMYEVRALLAAWRTGMRVRCPIGRAFLHAEDVDLGHWRVLTEASRDDVFARVKAAVEAALGECGLSSTVRTTRWIARRRGGRAWACSSVPRREAPRPAC